MMGRHPGFYSPLHSMWGTAFGTTAAASAKQYQGFAYPQPGHKDPADQVNNNHNSGNNADETYNSGGNQDLHQGSASSMDFKPPSDQLMQAYGNAAAGNMIHSSSSGRKMPEGTASTTSSSSSSASFQHSSTMPYCYYSSQDIASMYGGSFSAAGTARSSLASAPSRPKPKSRSNNAGKKTDQAWILTQTGGGGKSGKKL